MGKESASREFSHAKHGEISSFLQADEALLISTYASGWSLEKHYFGNKWWPLLSMVIETWQLNDDICTVLAL